MYSNDDHTKVLIAVHNNMPVVPGGGPEAQFMHRILSNQPSTTVGTYSTSTGGGGGCIPGELEDELAGWGCCCGFYYSGWIAYQAGSLWSGAVAWGGCTASAYTAGLAYKFFDETLYAPKSISLCGAIATAGIVGLATYFIPGGDNAWNAVPLIRNATIATTAVTGAVTLAYGAVKKYGCASVMRGFMACGKLLTRVGLIAAALLLPTFHGHGLESPINSATTQFKSAAPQVVAHLQHPEPPLALSRSEKQQLLRENAYFNTASIPVYQYLSTITPQELDKGIRETQKSWVKPLLQNIPP